jgi:hypothetical protein
VALDVGPEFKPQHHKKRNHGETDGHMEDLHWTSLSGTESLF